MPIYEYVCAGCGSYTSLFIQQYSPPSSADCEHCDSKDTRLIFSPVAIRVAHKSKYSTEFMEKTLPYLKSRKELKSVFESNPKESDEAKAFKVSEKIGESMDHMIRKNLGDK